MARTQVTQITSDLTGLEFRGTDIPDPVTVKVGNETGKLDLTATELDALTSLVKGDASKLRKLLAPAGTPATRAARSPRSDGSGQRERTDQEKADARAFAESLGADFKLSARGKIPLWAYERDAEKAKVWLAAKSPAPAAS